MLYYTNNLYRWIPWTIKLPNNVNFYEQYSYSVKTPQPFRLCNSDNCLYNRNLFSMCLAGVALFPTVTEPCPLVDGIRDRIIVIAVAASVNALAIGE